MSSSDINYKRDRVFRDPIHGLIPIPKDDAFLVELIDTPEFQRLRRVRQLGVANLTFPGAEHTRFNHSLGVYHIAARMLKVLESRYDNPIRQLTVSNAPTIKAAALLHDIGHGPFSHLMERAFDHGKQHEVKTQDLIMSADSEIPAILERAGVNPEEVRQVIANSFSYPFLQDIVSSQLDADRMDYLLRDSHYAGVNYGVFDLEWVLNCLSVGSYDEDSRDPKKWRLSLDDRRGLHAAEQLIQARQHMSQQVYFHRSTRRWEAVFLCMIREAAKLAESGELPPQTPEIVVQYLKEKGCVSHEIFLKVDEATLVSAFSIWSDAQEVNCKWLQKLSEGFLLRKKVLCHVELPLELLPKQEIILRQRLKKEFSDVPNSAWELDLGRFAPYKGPLPATKQTDLEGYQEGIQASSILLSDGNPEKTSVPVSEKSPLFEMLLKQEIRLCRLFCSQEIKSRMDILVKDVLSSD